MITVKINGKLYNLLFNASAMMAIRDKFETDNIVELIREDNALGFQRACKIAVILAEQGELLRRYMGHEQQGILTEDELRISLSPIGILELKNALADAQYDGYKREKKSEDDEVDLGLAELNKKKITG